jgi:hypothetical protein
MNIVKQVRTAAFAVAIVGLAWSAQKTRADSVTMQFSISSIAGDAYPVIMTGTFVASSDTPHFPDAYVATGLTGSETLNVPGYTGQYTLIPTSAGTLDPARGTGVYSSPDGGAYYYDDVVNPNAAPLVDGTSGALDTVAGLLFQAGPYQLNVFAGSLGFPDYPDAYFEYPANPVSGTNYYGLYYQEPVVFSLINVETIPALPAVPLPAAAGIGFSLLGGFGAFANLRKRFNRKHRIA